MCAYTSKYYRKQPEKKITEALTNHENNVTYSSLLTYFLFSTSVSIADRIDMLCSSMFLVWTDGEKMREILLDDGFSDLSIINWKTLDRRERERKGEKVVIALKV